MLGTLPWVDTEGEEFESERTGETSPPSVFFIRPLSMRVLLEMQGGLLQIFGHGAGRGTNILLALREGLVGWTNYQTREQRHEAVDCGLAHHEVAYSPSGVRSIPYGTKVRMAERISEISLLPTDGFEDELLNTVRAAYLRRASDDPKDWDCVSCTEGGIYKTRRCPYEMTEEEAMKLGPIDDSNKDLVDPWDHFTIKKGRIPRHITHGGHQYDLCPVGLAKGDDNQSRAESFFRWIVETDQGGLNPSQYLDLPGLYVQARGIINNEKAKIDEAEKGGRESAQKKDFENDRLQQKPKRVTATARSHHRMKHDQESHGRKLR